MLSFCLGDAGKVSYKVPAIYFTRSTLPKQKPIRKVASCCLGFLCLLSLYIRYRNSPIFVGLCHFLDASKKKRSVGLRPLTSQIVQTPASRKDWTTRQIQHFLYCGIYYCCFLKPNYHEIDAFVSLISYVAVYSPLILFTRYSKLLLF